MVRHLGRSRTRTAGRAPPSPCENDGLTLADHVGLLRDAGFNDVGTVWQFGNSHVLVAVR